MRYPSATRHKPAEARRFGRAEGGNVAVLFALVLPLVIGSAGLGVETTYWHYKRLQLQAAADSAAHAGAMERRSGSDAALVTTIATQAAEENGYASSAGTIQVYAPPISGPSTGGQAVEVRLTFNGDRFFTKIFSQGQVLIATRAVAAFNNASTACVLALHPTQGSAAQFQGSSTVTLNGCSVMANSVASDALAVQGATIVSTDCLIAVGGVLASGSITMSECEEPVENAPPVADPYANVPEPALPSGPCRNANYGPLPNVRYCNGLDLDGNTTLAPGVYYISGGNLRIGAHANITGNGVTFYLGAGAGLTINSNAKMTLKAPGPSSGSPYAGLLFFGARNSLGNVTFNGTADSKMTGALYFPSRDIRYNGNFSGENGCTQIVASTIVWTGNTSISADCTDYGIRPIPVLSLVKLTE
ncbi:pilus assembly protein TadG-related protein [Phenylobacterium sp.]|uniref:pilus assembly protein TadG-related protein n=1 Tax=Phenylobacterium sp. TaxID=1871053 RepID=UPI002E365B6F|nr:pilus assembly protein TadG-related protein [Phenylobacterium sp.]HEX2562255.1 pilus assembly protein TadG-related protein [Phenylobacterium sp.]